MSRRGLAIGIILLFVGVTIAPTINFNTVKASTDDDLVEVTTQACGIKGYGNTTVRLTREQYQNLEEYLVEFRARLNQTSTREEAIPIFKEAVVELDKYGLLPRGMSVERVQRLVIGGHQYNEFINRIKYSYFGNRINSVGESNYFCLVFGQDINSIAGRFVCTELMNFLFSLEGFLWKLIGNQQKPLLTALTLIIDSIGLFIYDFQLARNTFFPFFVGTEIYIAPLSGDITSIGLLGIKRWSGIIQGDYPFQSQLGGELGVVGFTGLHFITHNYHSPPRTILIGSAIGVKISLQNNQIYSSSN